MRTLARLRAAIDNGDHYLFALVALTLCLSALARPPVSDHARMVALASLAALLLASRARSHSALRPAAVAVAVFAMLDGLRLAWSPLVAARVPWACWGDVVAMGLMPGCWMGLLVIRFEHAQRPVWDGDEARGSDAARSRGDGQVRAISSRPQGAQGRGGPGRVRPAGAGDLPRGHRSPARTDRRRIAALLPALALLLYALLLLLSRHHPLVAAAWVGLLQAPRLVGGAWALGVIVRAGGWGWKDEGPGSEPPSPSSCACAACHTSQGQRPRLTWRTSRERKLTRPGAYAPRFSPSTSVGIILALGAAASVVGGLWSAWDAVRAVSTCGWILVAALALRTR